MNMSDGRPKTTKDIYGDLNLPPTRRDLPLHLLDAVPEGPCLRITALVELPHGDNIAEAQRLWMQSSLFENAGRLSLSWVGK